MSDQRPRVSAEPMKINLPRFVEVGMGLWVVALVLILVVPGWHDDGNAWRAWTCVAGFMLGAMGWTYLRRGRGNAAGM